MVWMDELTKRIAVAICDEERGPITESNHHCKTCRNAAFPNGEDGEWVDLGERCPGFGYEYLAEVVLAALPPPPPPTPSQTDPLGEV